MCRACVCVCGCVCGWQLKALWKGLGGWEVFKARPWGSQCPTYIEFPEAGIDKLTHSLTFYLHLTCCSLCCPTCHRPDLFVIYHLYKDSNGISECIILEHIGISWYIIYAQQSLNQYWILFSKLYFHLEIQISPRLFSKFGNYWHHIKSHRDPDQD